MSVDLRLPPPPPSRHQVSEGESLHFVPHSFFQLRKHPTKIILLLNIWSISFKQRWMRRRSAIKVFDQQRRTLIFNRFFRGESSGTATPTDRRTAEFRKWSLSRSSGGTEQWQSVRSGRSVDSGVSFDDSRRESSSSSSETREQLQRLRISFTVQQNLLFSSSR